MISLLLLQLIRPTLRITVESLEWRYPSIGQLKQPGQPDSWITSSLCLNLFELKSPTFKMTAQLLRMRNFWPRLCPENRTGPANFPHIIEILFKLRLTEGPNLRKSLFDHIVVYNLTSAVVWEQVQKTSTDNVPTFLQRRFFHASLGMWTNLEPLWGSSPNGPPLW